MPQDLTEAALNHLGDVLQILADLVPDERCAALEAATAFYNQHRPNAMVEPSGVWTTHLVNVHPVMGIDELSKDVLSGLLAT